MKKVAIFDLDGTLDLRDNFKLFLFRILIKSPQKWIYIPHLVFFFLKLYCIKDYKNRTNLKKIFLKILLSNQSQNFIENEAINHVERRIPKKFNSAVYEYFTLSKKLKKITILASGSLDVYVKHFAEKLGFDLYISTELNFKKGKFTGEIKNSNCIGYKKYLKINNYLKINKISWSDVTFFSNDLSDLHCFKRAKSNYVINPSKSILKTLDKKLINYKVLNSKS